MPYRMTIRSNPKLLIVPAVVLAGLGIAIALFTVGPVLGIVGLVVAGYFAWLLIRFVRKQLASSVEIREDAVVMDLYGEEKITARWADVTHAGTAADIKGKRTLFLYREGEDKLLSVPDEFERFDELVTEVTQRLRSATPDFAFRVLELEAGEALSERLRVIVGRPRPVEGDAEAGDGQPTLPPSP